MLQKKLVTFDKLNSIVYKEPQHKVNDLKPFMKNIEIRVIVVELIEQFLTKQNKRVSKFLVADHTGSVFLNVYDDDQDAIKAGDIIYMNGGYATNFKDQMVIHQGKNGLLKIIGEFFMLYQIDPNVSTIDWSTYIQKELTSK